MPIHWIANKDVSVNTIAWSPDGKAFAVACIDGSVQLWDANAKRVWNNSPCYSPVRKGYVDSVAWSPSGRYIAFGMSVNNLFQVFDPSFQRVISTFSSKQSVGYKSPLAWSPDGRYLAFRSSNGAVQVFEAASGKEVPPLPQHKNLLKSELESPDGRYLISISSGGTIEVLEVPSRKAVTIFKGHNHHALQIAWSPNGRYIASGGLDSTIRVWKAFSGDQLYTRDFTGHVEAIAWSPNGRYLTFWVGKELYHIEMRSENSFIY